MLGLAAHSGDAFGTGSKLIARSAGRRIDAAIAAIGDGWRRRLDVVGAATPRLNGRYRPWVGTCPEKQMHDFLLLSVDRTEQGHVQFSRDTRIRAVPLCPTVEGTIAAVLREIPGEGVILYEIEARVPEPFDQA